MIPRTPQAMPPADQSLLQYKSVTLEPNSRHEVYVSYITDGPCHFSVQLKKSESILVQLMREINSIPLKPFEELPIPGTVCLAKCVEDSHICRAVITSEVDNQYKLFYVDFGNTEIVPPDNLYQMPFKYIIPKIMAIRLSLDGVDKSTVTLEMQCAFKQFVDNRLLMMEVFPSAKKMALPKCRMWDPTTNIDVMEILNKAAQLAYPNAISLHRGFTRPIKVTFVYSCNKFYIHLKSNEDELSQLMANIQVYCNSVNSSFLDEPKVGLPCCAKFQHDGQWYRSLIVALNEDLSKVKYIDYGNEEDVPMQSLKTIQGEFLTCMRPQAIECCLNGYQNMTEDLEMDNKLEELILDQEFTMKVIDIVNGKSLVDLIDSEGRSVTALLMEAMVNQTKIQVIANGNDNNTTKHGGANSLKRNGKPSGEEQWQRDKSLNKKEKSDDWRQAPRNQNNNWSPQEKDKSFHNHSTSANSHSNSADKNGKEGGNGRNRSSRQDNEGYGNKENRSKPKNDNWGTDNSMHTWGENEEFQGVKKRTKNFSANNSSNRYKGRTDNEEWGNKKNTFNGNDFNEKKSYRDKNSYDSDSSSYKKGKSSERNIDSKPRYDRGDNRKKSFKRDNDNQTNDHEQTGGKKFNSRSDSKWTDRNSGNGSRTNSYNKPSTVINAAPNDASYQTLEVNGRQIVNLSWFHNPCSFFCQLKDSQQNFNSVMDEIQELYKDKSSSSAVEGAPAIALFPEDNVFYRTRILKSIGNKYKVYYVDFGNISVVDSVWPIDKKFMELPMQAIPCGLGGIQPVGDDWPDPNAFVNYMQKDSLDCEFQSYEVDRYMVNLYSNNQDIKQQLVDENLAKYVEKSVPAVEFDINFLAGHTFRAMLDSVKDLSDFSMFLLSGIKLSCSAHNLASATEIFEDELKEKIGQVLVVYCDNVIGDRLEVTLYDHVGNKLIILNPDEGAYDTIETVCPFLLVKAETEGFVSFINETSIVIQPSECTELLQTLLNEMYEHYESLSQESPIIPEEGFLYAVRCEEDSNWYRGRVTSFDDEKVTVLYVDYGNSEQVPFANLRELDPKFYWWDRMAILVEVNVPTVDLLEKNVKALVHYGDVGLVGEILDVEATYVPKEKQQPEITNVAPETDISIQTTDVPEVGENTVDIPIPVSSENEITKNEAKSLHKEENPSNGPIVGSTVVVISHIDSPSDFYIQLGESQTAISDLQSKIQEQIGEMPVLENTSIGGLCAAPYSVDQMWYRSQILDADEDITTVRFIDYGNTDVIDNKATQIKTLPAEFLALEEYARRCRLKIKPLEEEWSKPTTDRFEELAYAENVTVQFVNQDEKANYVELFSNGQNVKDLLIAENLAVLDEGLVLDAKLKGYVSHMNSPSEFWVQLESWCFELEYMAEDMSNASTYPDLEDFTPGSLCAAMFPDDEMWYRARILSNTVAGLEVLFLDYGNSCVCGNLKQLPEHLVMAPPLAMKCCLQKPEGLFSWSPEAVEKFAKLAASGQTDFTLKKLTTGETSMVELYVNGKEVSSMLMPTTEDVHVTDIKSMDNFAVSKDKTVSDERYRLEKIPGCEYNEECVSKFVELNNEGKTCYGMEYLSDNIVRLYLNGNDIRNEFSPILKDDKSQNLTELHSQNIDTTQTEEHHEISQEVTIQIYEIPQERESYEQQASEICNIPLTGKSGLPQDQTYETAQEKKSHDESQEEASKICKTLLENSITKASEEEVATLPQEDEIHEVYQEDTSQVCVTSESENIHDVSQEEIPQLYETLQDQETIQEDASKVCDISQSENIHNVPQQDNDNHEEKREAPKSCKRSQEEENHETAQEDISEVCDTSKGESTHEESQENSQINETVQFKDSDERDVCLTPLQIENQEAIQVSTKICDASHGENITDVPQEVASELHEMKQEKENREANQKGAAENCDTDHVDKSTNHDLSRACGISKVKENIEEIVEDTEVCDARQTTCETLNIVNEELSEKSNTVIEAITPQKAEINEVAQKHESCDNKIEDNLEETKVCDTPNPGEIQEVVIQDSFESKKNLENSHTEISVSCDTKCEKDDTTPQTNQVNKVLQEDKREIPQAENLREQKSEKCDCVNDGEVTLSASKDCDSPQGKEKGEFVQEETSESYDEVQEEKKELYKETSDPWDKLKAVVTSTEVCDMPKHSLRIDSNEKTEVPNTSSKLEFTEKIMTSFSAPTVSEKESIPKLSPAKVTPKVQEGSEGPVEDSSKLEE